MNIKRFAVILIALLSACTNSSYKNVSVNDLNTVASTNPMILDVRQPEEYAAGHVKNAKLVPLASLESRLSEIPSDQAVFVICHTGRRSKIASELLNKNGKTDIRNVEGGMVAWQAAGFSVER
jgi:rhodanese-related sulfurtransferase